MKSNLVWPPVMKGRYRHSKKGITVDVIGGGKHSETLEDFVVYLHDGKIWIRPYTMFFEEIELDGKKVSRFELIP